MITAQLTSTGKYLRVFDSITEMIDDVYSIRNKINKYTYFGSAWWPSVHMNKEFVGRYFPNWEDWRDKVSQVWNEGMYIYERMLNELKDEHILPPKSLKRKSAWSEDDGDEVDIDRLRRYQPYWRTTHRSHRPGPVSVTIITDITTSGCVDSMDVLWRGASAVVLTELLEAAGYRVELWATQHCHPAYRSGKGIVTAVCLKRGCDPLDTSTLINCVSGWFYRTGFFASYWLAEGETPTSGLGTILSIDDIANLISQDEQMILCKGIWKRETALYWIKNQIEQLK